MNKIYQKRLEGAAKKNVSAWIKAADYDTVKAKYIKGGEYILANLWIPVEEDLPKDEESVFVRNKDGKCTSAWYSPIIETWFLTMGEIAGEDVIYSKITHWMPIPELKGGAQ